MAETRSVVITGASRGLGFASASHLYRERLACCRGDAVGRRRHGNAARRDRRVATTIRV